MLTAAQRSAVGHHVVIPTTDLLSVKIAKGMSDSERAAILSQKYLTNIPTVRGLPSHISSWEEINRYFGSEKRKLIQKIALEFGVFKDYKNEDIDLSFEFSNNNFRESYGKQKYRFEQFAKMFSVFDQVIHAAIGIEVHKREDYKPDITLKHAYVLISAFQDGEWIIPVKLEIKEFADKANSLYVAVSLDGIKMTEVSKQGTTENGVAQNSRSVTISISDLMQKVNPKHTNFTKYFPKAFLTEAQKRELRSHFEKMASEDESASSVRYQRRKTDTPEANEVLRELFANHEKLSGYEQYATELAAYQKLQHRLDQETESIVRLDAKLEALREQPMTRNTRAEMDRLNETRNKTQRWVEEIKRRMFAMEAKQLGKVVRALQKEHSL
ncbi:MAG: hypothetical protein IJX13_02055, partial [Clostridia bacterium]|nr:hypothetical protein [Clostridia bacterium]